MERHAISAALIAYGMTWCSMFTLKWRYRPDSEALKPTELGLPPRGRWASVDWIATSSAVGLPTATRSAHKVLRCMLYDRSRTLVGVEGDVSAILARKPDVPTKPRVWPGDECVPVPTAKLIMFQSLEYAS